MYGLVLEGGGIKGSYHIGVYKAILEEEINIKAVAGTSIGALNGAMIVQGDFEKILKLWNEISYTDIIKANEDELDKIANSKLNLEDLRHISKKLYSVISDRGFDIEPFKEMLKEYVDEDKIRNSSMDFGMVTINLSDLVPLELFIEDIPKGRVEDFLLASSYVPIFKMERLGGKLYLDGGFYDNLPYKMLQKKGYKKLILVRTHAKGIVRKPLNNENMTVITPSRDIGKSYICDRDKVKENIDMGYYDALKVFRGLKGNLYYIEPEKEEFFLEYLLSLSKHRIAKILKQLNLDSAHTKRSLFELIIPKLGALMGLQDEFNYEDVFVSLLEKKALKLGVKEYKIYKFQELIKAVKAIEPFEDEDIETSNSIEKMLEKVDLAKYFNKEETILEIANIIFIDEFI